MTNLRSLLVGAGVLALTSPALAAEVVTPPLARNPFTPAGFTCMVLNTGKSTLTVDITILDQDGVLFSAIRGQDIPARTIGSIGGPISTSDVRMAYCTVNGAFRATDLSVTFCLRRDGEGNNNCQSAVSAP